jgi:AMMECR1 domain-containing protein
MTDLTRPGLSRLAPLAAVEIVALAVAFTAAARIPRGATPGVAGTPEMRTPLAETGAAISAALRAPRWTPRHLDDIVLGHARARFSD